MPDELQAPNTSAPNTLDGTQTGESALGGRDVVAELRAQLEASNAEWAQRETEWAEKEAALVQAAEAASQAQTRVSELETWNAELQSAALAAHRRALLAEHAGQVVPELVQGDTLEDLEASVAAARDAYGRVAEQVRVQAAAMVPAGASPRTGPAPEELSPLEKITSVLTRNGR